jgi:hypothetical protein
MIPLAPHRRDLLTMAAALGFATQTQAADMTRFSPIVELRQYTTHPGRRDDLIALFDREFVTPQEADGIRVIGQFRDLDDPNRFVWMRGFPDLKARAASLTAFYGGPVWRAHRDAANATMLDSDNVLLLHPLGDDGGFDLQRRAADGLVVAEIRYLDRTALPAFSAFFAQHMRPRIAGTGARVLATLVTDDGPNNFALPVRENVCVLVAVLGFADAAHHAAYSAALAKGPDWRTEAPEPLLAQFARKPEVLRLTPTAGSRLRG